MKKTGQDGVAYDGPHHSCYGKNRPCLNPAVEPKLRVVKKDGKLVGFGVILVCQDHHRLKVPAGAMDMNSGRGYSSSAGRQGGFGKGKRKGKRRGASGGHVPCSECWSKGEDLFTADPAKYLVVLYNLNDEGIITAWTSKVLCEEHAREFRRAFKQNKSYEGYSHFVIK